jgi:hypothetical protein
MNKQSRARLAEAVTTLTELADAENLIAMADVNIQTMLDEASNLITDVGSEEREKFDNMPEGLQSSPTGEAIEQAADTLEYLNWPTWDRTEDDDWADTLADEVQAIINEVEELL